MSEFIRGRITDSGRVVIPAELRRELQIEDGQEIVFCRGKDAIELLTVPQAIRRSQDMLLVLIPDQNLDLTQELLDAR